MAVEEIAIPGEGFDGRDGIPFKPKHPTALLVILHRLYETRIGVPAQHPWSHAHVDRAGAVAPRNHPRCRDEVLEAAGWHGEIDYASASTEKLRRALRVELHLAA